MSESVRETLEAKDEALLWICTESKPPNDEQLGGDCTLDRMKTVHKPHHVECTVLITKNVRLSPDWYCSCSAHANSIKTPRSESFVL